MTWTFLAVSYWDQIMKGIIHSVFLLFQYPKNFFMKHFIPTKVGFTIAEIIISLTLFSMIMIFAFQALANIGVVRIQTLNKVDLESELYYFSEKLASLIKDGGTIDYEEYWNRKVRGTGSTYWYYDTLTGFGNYGSGWVIDTDNVAPDPVYGSGFYFCRSNNGAQMVSSGCLLGSNTFSNLSQSGVFQRYGEYKYQFIDYNGNYNGDNGDEDGNWSIQWDEDDVDLWEGPTIFDGNVRELYLYNPIKKERIFFRWKVGLDPNRPTGTTCTGTTGTGCLGNIEILKLVGKDFGEQHNGTSSWAYDSNIDTWVCHADWEGNCKGPVTTVGTIPTGTWAEWIPLFPSYINVENIEFKLYPNKDPLKAWSTSDPAVFVHPYVRMKLTLGFAWNRRKAIKDDNPKVNISTTLSLSEF